MRNLVVLALVGLLAGCTAQTLTTGDQRPMFYPNEHYQKMGAGQAERDTRECMMLADQYVENPEYWKDATKGTAKGAVGGAAAGALSGVIFGNTGRGTAAGAAGGAIIGLLGSMDKMGQGNPDYKSFVNQCLAQKGYQVYGWK